MSVPHIRLYYYKLSVCVSPVYSMYHLGPWFTHIFPGNPQIPPRLTISSIPRVSTPAEASTLTPQSELALPALLLNSPKEARSSTVHAAGARAGLDNTIIGDGRDGTGELDKAIPIPAIAMSIPGFMLMLSPGISISMSMSVDPNRLPELDPPGIWGGATPSPCSPK